MKRNISKIRLEVLNKFQKRVFPKLESFSKQFILGGGTSVSLLLAHRYSFDFDLFSEKPISPHLLQNVNRIFSDFSVRPLVDNSDELTVLLDEINKITWLFFPFPALYPVLEIDGIPIFDLRDLISNKAYVIGRRGEWKDYVDMFFALMSGMNLKQIIKDSERRFGGNFNKKLFLEQLIYTGDIKDFSVEFIERAFKPKQIISYLKREVKKIV